MFWPVPILLLGIASLFVFTALLQWLWNTTMPELFHLPPLRYWQALRLLLITSILFGTPGFIRFGEMRPPVEMTGQANFRN